MTEHNRPYWTTGRVFAFIGAISGAAITIGLLITINDRIDAAATVRTQMQAADVAQQKVGNELTARVHSLEAMRADDRIHLTQIEDRMEFVAEEVSKMTGARLPPKTHPATQPWSLNN